MMHSIRRGAALLEPVVALVVAVSLAVPWVLEDTGSWRLPGFAVLGMLALSGALGLGGFRLPVAVLLRTALAVGALVLAAAALPTRPIWLDACFAVVAVAAALVLPGRLSPIAAVVVAAGFGVGALSGPEPFSPVVAAGGAGLLLVLGLCAGWLAGRADDPIPDPAVLPADGEGLLGVAFETAAGGLALLGPDGRVVRANQALGDMLGRSAEAMTGTSWWAHLGPQDAAPLESRFKQLMSGEIWNFHIEARLRTRDRRSVGAVIGMSTIALAASDPEMAFVQVVNINDRIRDETKLRQRAAEMRRNFDRAPVPMWEVSLTEIEPALERWRRDDTTDLMAHFERHPDVLRHTVSTLDIVDANEAAKKLVGADGREEFVRGVRGGRLG